MTLPDMDVAEAITGSEYALDHSVFLDVHVVGVEVDKDVGAIDLLQVDHSLFRRIHQVRLVAVHDFHVEADTLVGCVIGHVPQGIDRVLPVFLGRRLLEGLKAGGDGAVDNRAAPGRDHVDSAATTIQTCIHL